MTTEAKKKSTSLIIVVVSYAYALRGAYERAADTLHGARVNLEALRYLPDTVAGIRAGP